MKSDSNKHEHNPNELNGTLNTIKSYNILIINSILTFFN